MGAQNFNSKQRKFYKLRTDKATKVPAFIEKVKKGDEYVDGDQYTIMTGYLTKVSVKEVNFPDGKKKEFVVIEMDDDADRNTGIIIETGWNYLVRSILNSLATPDAIAHTKISVYKNKNNGYPAAYIEVNHQKVGWKYNPKELPEVKKIEFKGEVISDDTALNAFFRDEIIPYINKKIAGEFEGEAVMSEFPVSGNGKTYEEPIGLSDDLPF